MGRLKPKGAISIRLDYDIEEKLREVAAKNDVSITDVVKEAIMKYFGGKRDQEELSWHMENLEERLIKIISDEASRSRRYARNQSMHAMRTFAAFVVNTMNERGGLPLWTGLSQAEFDRKTPLTPTPEEALAKVNAEMS